MWGVGFGRELSVRPSVRLSSRGSTELAERPKSHAEVRTGVGFYPFSGGQLPNFQGKSPGIFPLITPISGTFWLTKSLKVLPNKVFRFIQQTLINKLMAKLLVVLELESTLIMTLADLDSLPIDYN